MKMDSPDALFTVLLRMPQSQRKHIVGKRTAAAVETQWRAGQPWLPMAPQQCRHRWGFWGGTELFVLEGIQYSQSKIFLKGTKKHKSSAPSFNSASFPLFPLFHGPAYRSYINYDPFSSGNKPLLWPDFPLQLSSKVVLSSFTSFHAPCTNSRLYSNPALLSCFKSTMSNTSQENAFRSAPS